MSDKKINVAITGAVPILGETKHAYMIGGAAFGFAANPDDLLQAFHEELGKGVTAPHLFVLQWQRTAMHLAYHDERLKRLEHACVTLRHEVVRLRKQLAEDPGTQLDYAAELGELEAKN